MIKRIICALLCAIILCSVSIVIYAEESTDIIIEEVEFEDVFTEEVEFPCPYALYIMGVNTTITDKEDGKIYMGVQVYCTETMQEIMTVFYLQQIISDQWVNVGSTTVTSEDVDHHVKVMSVRDVPSGVYRIKTVNRVRDYTGYAESVTGFSPDMTYVNPNL